MVLNNTLCQINYTLMSIIVLTGTRQGKYNKG